MRTALGRASLRFSLRQNRLTFGWAEWEADNPAGQPTQQGCPQVSRADSWQSTQALRKMSQDYRQTAQNQLESLAASAAERITTALKDSSEETEPY